MILITDGGSTKCDWLALGEKGNPLFPKERTKGMNPAILTKEKLYKIIKENTTVHWSIRTIYDINP